MSVSVRPLEPRDKAAWLRLFRGYIEFYKAIVPEAEDAAVMACDLATGQSVPSSMTNGKTTNNKTADVPSVLLTPVAVNKANIKDTIVKDKFWTAADICTSAYAAACTAAGIQ